MTARIIETNDTPLKKVDVEGVTADIIELQWQKEVFI